MLTVNFLQFQLFIRHRIIGGLFAFTGKESKAQSKNRARHSERPHSQRLRGLISGLFVVLILFSGCTKAGNYIAGPSIKQSPEIQYPAALEPITIGLTTKEEIRQRFGPPKDLQTSTLNGSQVESWSYAVAEPPIHPLQYVPLLGVFALPAPPKLESFSVSFSDQDVVEGVTLWKVQPYDNTGTYQLLAEPWGNIEPYGTKNPLTYNVENSSEYFEELSMGTAPPDPPVSPPVSQDNPSPGKHAKVSAGPKAQE